MAFAIFRSPPVAVLWKHEGEKRTKKQGVLRISPFRERLSKAVSSLFWFRNLEDPRASLLSPPSFPKIPPYPQGLSSMDLLMSDIDALKAYARYLQNVSQVWSMPLPECYDQEKVAYYFSCRPHVIAFRILEVISSFAFAGIKLQTSRSFKFKKQGLNKDDASDSLECYIGQLLKESMLNLGPTFVKVGQSLSTRPDIFGSEISKALSELHDRVPPFPRATAMKIIEEELGCPVEKIFSYISMEPVAAASFGQVYRCCTLDGCVVAVKVQRPELLHAVVRDIYILRLGLELLRKIAKRKSDLGHYADELGKGLVGELDYNLEAANASQFLEAHSNYPFMLVPKVFRHLTRKRVLRMDWVTGENPNSLLLQSRGSGLDNIACSQRQQLDAKAHLLDLVNKGVEATLVQLLETGLLHADPHPGNLCYTPDGRIGFLDFGLLCRMERRHQLAMLASIMHIINGDWGALVYDLTLMDVVKPGTNLRQVTMDLEDALGEVVFKDGIPDIKFSRVLGKIWSVALKYHFRMPSYYTLVLRSLASLEGLALSADQDFKTFQAAYPYVVQKLFHDNSIATRKILYSVVFNKKREFQWHKIFLFLKISSMRKDKVGPNMFSTESSHAHSRNGGDVGVIEATQLILRLVASKDGCVLRRLLMAADGASLSRAMVSKDATLFRRHLSRVLADVIYKWMVGAAVIVLYDQQSVVEEREKERVEVMQSIVRDRRVRAIFYKVVSDTRRSGDPILMARACWSSCAVFTTASVIAFRRFLLHLLAALYTRFVL